ncbi:MAG TPA: PAS domain-containing protein, partial [Paludibacter sp.]|nr:PAS domain-containing protein [Paludibacter sp.]
MKKKDSCFAQCFSLIDKSMLPILFVNYTGVVTYANPSFLRLIACDDEIACANEYIRHRTIFDFFETGDMENGGRPEYILESMYSRKRSDGDVEFQVKTHEGAMKWVALEDVTKFEAESGVEYQLVLKDIPRKRRGAVQPPVSNPDSTGDALLAAFMENMPVMALATNTAGEVTSVNKRFADVCNEDAGDIVGRQLDELEMFRNGTVGSDLLELNRKVGESQCPASRKATLLHPAAKRGISLGITTFPLMVDGNLVGLGTVLVEEAGLTRSEELENIKEELEYY